METPETIREIARLGDIYVSTNSGEGFGKCLHPDSPIITIDGVNKIKDITPVDLVLDENGKWTNVIATKEKDYDGDLIEIKAWGNIPILVTPEHKIKAFKRPKKRYKKLTPYDETIPKWIEAKDLNKGDVVVFPQFSQKTYKNVEIDLMSIDSTLKTDGKKVWYKMGYSGITKELVKVNRFILLDSELAKLLGIYVAEGSKSEIGVGEELDIIDELEKIYINKFGVTPKIYKKGCMYRFGITQSIIQKLFIFLCGKYSKNKTISNFILENYDETILKQFLKFYWLGDGKKSTFMSGFTTVSLNLLSTLKMAFTSLKECPMIENDNNNSCYRLYSRSGNIVHSNKSWINKNGFVGYLIKNINKIPYKGKVIDIQTKSGNFSTLSFIVHNCGLEAMSLRIPPIITDYAASSEVHQKGSILVPCYEGRQGRFRHQDRMRGVQAGIVNEEKFVEAMLYLYNNPEERMALGREGRRWAREFDYDTKIIPQWINLFNSISPEDVMLKEMVLEEER